MALKRPAAMLSPDLQQENALEPSAKRRKSEENHPESPQSPQMSTMEERIIRKIYLASSDMESSSTSNNTDSSTAVGTKPPKGKGHNKAKHPKGRLNTGPPLVTAREGRIRVEEEEVQIVHLKNPNASEKENEGNARAQGDVDTTITGLVNNRRRGPSIRINRATTSIDIRQGDILKRLKERNPGKTNFARNFRQPCEGTSEGNDRNSIVHNPSVSSFSFVDSTKKLAVHHQQSNVEWIRYRELLENNHVEGFQPKTAEIPKDFSFNFQFPGQRQLKSPFFNRPAVTSTPLLDAAISRSRISTTESAIHREHFKKRTQQDPIEVVDLSKEDDYPINTRYTDKPHVEDIWKALPSEQSKAGEKNASRPGTTNEEEVRNILREYAHRRRPSSAAISPITTTNTLEDEMKANHYYSKDFLPKLGQKYDDKKETKERQVKIEKTKLKHTAEQRTKLFDLHDARILATLKVTEEPIPALPFEETIQLPEITDQMEAVIEKARNSHNQTLVDKFSIAITGKDIQSLAGLNWLNDEVINFYMQLICERSKANDNWPNVYAFNTFFYPKLMKGGHSALKRWTRKIDIFSYDIILIPVHLGVHWCLATVDFRKPGIYYYDSMGGDNHKCLAELKKYLEAEHLDKKKSNYSTAHFQSMLVKDIPQQENGSDCGMFTCKFAEYLSRDADITFTQQDMPYYRKRIVYEIVAREILHP